MMRECSVIPELPDAKKQRYVKEYGLKEYDAAVITSVVEMARFFEDMIQRGADAKLSTTWLTVELLGRLHDGLTLLTSPVNSEKLANLVMRISDSTISGKAAKDVLDYLMKNDDSVDSAIEKLGLKQVSDDGAIQTIIDEIISLNGDKVTEYKNGKEKLFGFFVGQVMKASRGKANPAKVNELLRKELG
jgi:aspartyl-tRNA(Asn)/glutamyl-tRNA(Gln) amidotransferase subunit B